MSNNWLELNGKILEILPADYYNVQLCTVDITVKANRSWKMKQRRISLLEWDHVKLEISEYDNTKGRIVYRYRSDAIPEECWWK